VTATDSMIFKGSTLIALEGSPAPIAGRNWASVLSTEMSLNNDGDVLMSSGMDGAAADNLLIAKNGAKFRQEGDTLPAFSPSLLTSFGTGPLLIADRGAPDEDPDVLWFGDWDNADTTIDTGLFLDSMMLFQEGVDTIGGVVIDDIRAGVQDGAAMSDDGRYIIAKMNLVGSIDTAVLLDLGPWKNLGKSKQVTTRPKLRGFGQLSSGSTMTIRLTNGLPNGTAHLIIGVTRIDFPTFGGTLVPSPDAIVFGVPLDANGEVTISGTLPTVPSGVDFYMQYWCPDGATLSASNGIQGTTQ
jgi:hypothetical protein